MAFRFLDLAAELRNNIYEEALTHDRANGKTAAVGLLRTCRQVHDEAMDILYSQSSFTMSVVFTKSENECKTSISGDVRQTFLNNASIIEHMQSLPPQLCAIETINVEIGPDHYSQCDNEQDKEMLLATARFCYALALLLHSDGASHILNVTVSHYDVSILSYGGAQSFLPLGHLQPQTKVMFLGLSDGAMTRLQDLCTMSRNVQGEKMLESLRRLRELEAATAFNTLHMQNGPLNEHLDRYIRNASDMFNDRRLIFNYSRDAIIQTLLTGAEGILEMRDSEEDLSYEDSCRKWLQRCLGIFHRSGKPRALEWGNALMLGTFGESLCSLVGVEDSGSGEWYWGST